MDCTGPLRALEKLHVMQFLFNTIQLFDRGRQARNGPAQAADRIARMPRESFEVFWAEAVGWVWGLPLVATLGLAGVYFTFISRLTPLKHLRHAFAILSGRFDRQRAPGEITHFRALSAALSGTIGMGNIAGVAIAITAGGSGAVFWMWVAGALGMATKFFTCTLSCMYRKPDVNGIMQGGPMYYIEIGLGRAVQTPGVAVRGLRHGRLPRRVSIESTG